MPGVWDTDRKIKTGSTTSFICPSCQPLYEVKLLPSTDREQNDPSDGEGHPQAGFNCERLSGKNDPHHCAE